MATLQEAQALIDRMAESKPTCDACEHVPIGQGDCPAGWEPSCSNAAWLRRCPTCNSALMFPWAKLLDAASVQSFMQKYATFDVSMLRTLVKE